MQIKLEKNKLAWMISSKKSRADNILINLFDRFYPVHVLKNLTQAILRR